MNIKRDIQRQLTRELNKAREDAFLHGVRSGMEIQEQIFEDECPQAYFENYGTRSKRRELVEQLEQIVEEHHESK